MAVKQRGHGEGSIGFYGGRWVAQATVDGGGRRRFYGKTRAEANAKLQAALGAVRAGLPVPTDRLTVAEYLDDWLTGASRALRPSTAATYERHIRLHILPTLGRLPIARLRPEQLDRLYAALLAKGLSRTSVQHIHAILRRSLSQATRRGVIARNPTDLVDPPGRDHPEMQVLSVDQARALLATARTGRYAELEALYVLALTTGMRRGELLALRWADVDVVKRTLTVTGTLQRVKHSDGTSTLERARPKTKTSMRQIPLTAAAVDALKRHAQRQGQQRAVAGSEWTDTGLAFTNERGGAVEPRNLLSRSFAPLLSEAGIPHVRFHDLRHTAATLMAAQGVHTKVVSEMLGHASVGITLDLYSHVTPSMAQQAVTAMENLFDGG
ncbi:MAG TPA: site-specific integrase [Candidatus Dormibacteraeota bacterium]|jgi:integrase|nr:site-specific integrase [Candidatus Dormibacteraeota bacterium]